jgi:hypothetical protein
MFGKFKWSAMVMVWLSLVVLVCTVISLNMPVHPKPNETVYLPGYQLLKYAMYIISISMIMAAIRKRQIILNFEVNWIEGFVALTGVALFISPFIALLAKFLYQVIANANT